MRSLLVRSELLGLLCIGLIIIALVVGYIGWREYRRAEVVIEWTTASELNTVGFNIYRSKTADGPFDKVNDVLIPASPDPLIGGSYEYIDNQVEPGVTYYYELEDVEFDANSSRYGPIEVQARRGGSVELLMSLLLIGIGVVGISSLAKRRAAQKNEANQI